MAQTVAGGQPSSDSAPVALQGGQLQKCNSQMQHFILQLILGAA